MNQWIRNCLACLLVIPAGALADDGAVSEIIYLIQDDGRTALVYTTVRSKNSKYQLELPVSYGSEPQADKFLYIFPEEHEWQASDYPGFRRLRLADGDFATLRQVDLNGAATLTTDDSGNYTFRTPPGEFSGSREGIWNDPDGFQHLAYTWAFPAAYEPVSYEANQPGNWVKRGNTITYYGKDVNNLLFTITYRSRLNELYDQLRKMFGDEDKIGVSEDAEGVRVSIEATLLYPSGVAELSAKGREVISRLTETLQQNPELRIIVEGHTDTDRITGALAKTFPTNWELSAARSINVVRYLGGLGVDETRFESRAFSSTRPVASNESNEGKAKNRRIELLFSRE